MPGDFDLDGWRGYDRVLTSTTVSPPELAPDDPRVRRALFTLRESAAYLDVPVSTRQQHFAEVIRDYLRRISYGDDGWAERVRLPAHSSTDVVVDPEQAFGQPLIVHGGARVEDLVDRFQAGDNVADVAADFGVAEPEVEDVIRVALRLAP